MKEKKVAIYVRVSTDENKQDINNQLNPLKELAKAKGWIIYKEYIDYASGSKSNRPAFREMMDIVKSNRKPFDLILIWALDRFSREGISNTLGYFDQLKKKGISLKSYEESWLDTSNEGFGELLIAIFSWVAKQERERISARVKAGLKKAKNVGKRGKDKKPRKKSGYLNRWSK